MPSTRSITRALSRPLSRSLNGDSAGGGDPDAPISYDYLIESEADWDTVFANDDATLSGKVIAFAPGSYAWNGSAMESRNFASKVTIASLYSNNRAIVTLASGPHNYIAPKNTEWNNVRFYAPFTPGVDNDATPALRLKNTTDGLEFVDCELYGNLRALVEVDGWPDNMADWGWRGFIGLDGTSSLGTGGLKITDCKIHSGRRLLNLFGGTGPLEIVGNELYDFGVDAMLISGAQPALKVNWNQFHSPLSGWSGNDIPGTFDPATDRFTSTSPHGLSIGSETLDISPNTGVVPGGLALGQSYVCTVIDANVIEFPVDVTSAGTDVRVYREPAHADFMQAVPGANDWDGFEIIGNRFTSERYDALDSFRDAQVIFLEDINVADDDANHYENGLVALNMMWTENRTHGITVSNPIDCVTRNNTLIGLENVSGGLPIRFNQHFSSGTGSGNIAFGNVCISKPVSQFAGDRLEGNFLAGFGGASHADTYVGPDTAPETIAQLTSRYAIKTDSIAYLMEPKCGAQGTGYVDYNARTYSLPAIPAFDLIKVSEILGSTSFSFVVNTSRGAGTIYWMVSDTVRTAAQVIAQGTATAKGTVSVSGTGNQSSINATGLSSSTGYYLFVVQVDGSDQSQMIVYDFTTNASAGFSIVDNQGSVYLTRSGGWSSPTNTKRCTFAIRGKMLAGDGSVLNMLRQHTTSATPINCQRLSTNKFRVEVRNAGGTIIGRFDTSANINVALGTFWLVVSCDLGGAVRHVYLNGAEGSGGTDTLTDDTINFSSTQTLSILASPAGANLCDMEIEYIYLSNEFVDLTNSATLEKFNSLAAMESDGSGPTGNQPLLFMTGNAAVWNAGTNSGTGGAFTATGTFADA